MPNRVLDLNVLLSSWMQVLECDPGAQHRVLHSANALSEALLMLAETENRRHGACVRLASLEAECERMRGLVRDLLPHLIEWRRHLSDIAVQTDRGYDDHRLEIVDGVVDRARDVLGRVKLEGGG